MLRNLILLFLAAIVLSSCPDPEADSSASTSPSPAQGIDTSDPLAAYGKLKLGMNSIEIAQAYPAPDGKGEGYTRIIEDYDAAGNHIIQFEPKDKVVQRIVLRVFRDQLAKLVDRRDGLTAPEAAKWLDELRKTYGEPEIVIPDIQWSWGSRGGTLLTYTQDNASEEEMSANVVLEHQPTYEASVEYLRARESAKSGAAD